ncbi:MAG: glycosyltransferase [Eubacteriales bacterium]|nr:glycosyltransferase [Eubacteriales bacterium]
MSTTNQSPLPFKLQLLELTSTLSNLAKRLLDILLVQGVRILGQKILNRLNRVNFNRMFRHRLYQQADKPVLRAKVLADASLGKGPLISLIVPLYNTDLTHLNEMIESVLHQNYPRWQLCLADGSDAAHDDVGKTVALFLAQDDRISYIKLATNQGISGNTNAAMQLAHGDFFGLLDHDDLLAPDALAEMALVIHRQQADFIYSDELNFTENLDHVRLIHFKPDFALDNLRSNNYICHLSVFARDLVDRVGAFDPQCDGSQDYDYILRLTEKARHIVHIPKVLYYWRIHGKSVASDISVKPYCLDAARLALSNHFARCGVQATVENNTILSTYRIRYPVSQNQLTHVLITVEDRNQLARLLYVVKQDAGAPVVYCLIVPENVLASAKRRDSWQQNMLKGNASCRFVYYHREESLAAVLNREIRAVESTYVALLDGAIVTVSPQWLLELLMFVQRPDIAMATGKVTYRHIVQQAGLATGVHGSIGAYHAKRVDGEPGYMARLQMVNNISLADRLAMVFARQRFIEMGGFNEAYHRDFFDLDLGLQWHKAGLPSVFTPYATFAIDDPRDLPVEVLNHGLSFTSADRKLLKSMWDDVMKQPDLYYNPNFNPNHARFDHR